MVNQFERMYVQIKMNRISFSGDHWHKHRKIITPAFHFQILERYVEAFDGPCDIFVDILRDKQLEGVAFDIHPYVNLCALDIMCGMKKIFKYGSL